MWMVDPATMCRKHLLGEHVEIHMFVGTLRKGLNMDGYLTGNLLEPSALMQRHEELAVEMERRGYKHRSPLLQPGPYPREWEEVHIDRAAALAELHRRCPECRRAVLSGKGGAA